VAVGAGAVWVANVSDRTVSRVDGDSLSVTATVGLGFEPTDLAADDDFVWVVGGYDHALWRLDRDGTARLKTRFVERFGPLPEGHDSGAAGIALAPGVVWLTHGDEVSAIDPMTGITVSSVKAGGRWQRAIASDENTVWVGYDDSVRADVSDHYGPDPRVDLVSVPDSGVVDSVELSSRASEVIVASGSVWIALPVPGLVSQLVGDRVLRTVPAGNEPVGLAFADGSLWVTNQRDGLVRRLNVSTGDAEAVIDLAHTVEDVDAAGGRVYVAVRKP
jgi:streptogramin lyase